MTLKELIEALEKASGPDRVLDLAISVAVNFKGMFDTDHIWRWGAGGDEIEGHKEGDKRRSFLDPCQFVPRWTASIDAALTLVPTADAHSVPFWRVGNDGEGGNPADFKAEVYVWHPAASEKETAVAATPALALCIAALKARDTPA